MRRFTESCLSGFESCGRSRGSVASHHVGLATDDEQDATVAEDENHENDHVEAHKIPDPERHPSPLVLEKN